MSKFDYPDPSLDPSYCDGLAADDRDNSDLGPTCYWCGQPTDSEIDIYCSALCANYALTDDCER